MKSNILLNRIAVGVSTLMVSFAASAQQGAPTTPQGELNRINATLNIQNGATIRGNVVATVTANDPFAGRGSGNGDGIARIDIRVLDARSGSVLAGTDFARGGSSGGFISLAPPPYTANFNVNNIVSPSQGSREVIVEAVIKGFVQNSRVVPGRRIQPITTIARRVTVINNNTGRPTRTVIATLDPNTIEISTPSRIRTINILDFNSLQSLQTVNFPGDSFTEVVQLNGNVPNRFIVSINNRRRKVAQRTR